VDTRIPPLRCDPSPDKIRNDSTGPLWSVYSCPVSGIQVLPLGRRLAPAAREAAGGRDGRRSRVCDGVSRGALPRCPERGTRPGFTAVCNTARFHRTLQHGPVSPHFATRPGFTALCNTARFHRIVQQGLHSPHFVPIWV